MTKQKGWLLEWLFYPGKYAIADSVIGLLPARWSTARVEEHVRQMFVLRSYTFEEIAGFCRTRRDIYEPVWDQFHTAVFYGDNPALSATQVDELRVAVHPGSGIETITWRGPAQRRISPSTGFPEVVGDGAWRTHTRSHVGPMQGMSPKIIDE